MTAWTNLAFAPFDAHLLAAADCRDGHRVLDVGCGSGATTLAVAGQVGRSGQVVAVDVAAAMCTAAEAAAEAGGLSQVSVMNADAATATFGPAPFDRVVSRFGTMFFADPAAAFGHIRSAMASDATLTFVSFGARTANPWIDLPVSVLARHLPAGRNVGPDPMAFSLSDPDRISAILTDAGFTDVRTTRLSADVTLGGGAGPEAAAQHLLGMEFPARVLRLVDSAYRADAVADLERELGRHAGTAGVSLPAQALLTSARPGRRQDRPA
ncbi:class I SAM-dependent methyltransferase [Micromonospora sp. CPCC 206060]|uniref:class I SAM-dependent methyltransferase n=1 Tax=Micromonospora sp. CPCC 206060 TaxID=3122406 RepID=UPI002FF242A8